MANIQTFLKHHISKFQSNLYYQKISSLPSSQRWLSIAGIFLLFLCLLFGILYLVFDKLVVIGFFASILAGLATGIGALPAVFFKNISTRVFNSLLGAAAGVMLAATAFSLLVPGIDFGDQIWPGKGLWPRLSKYSYFS